MDINSRAPLRTAACENSIIQTRLQWQVLHGEEVEKQHDKTLVQSCTFASEMTYPNGGREDITSAVCNGRPVNKIAAEVGQLSVAAACLQTKDHKGVMAESPCISCKHERGQKGKQPVKKC